MKAESKRTANTLRGTLLLTMATLGTLAKQRRGHLLKAPCLHLAKRYFNCQKTKGAGFKPPREAARSLQVSRFCFEIWEREAAPANYCLIRRLSMDRSCPSLPPKILVRNETDAELRPNEQTTVYMAAQGCHFVDCCWYVLLVIIESFSSQCATLVSAQPSLYKTGPPILSRTFSKNNLRTHVRVGFDNFVDRIVAYILDSRIAN